MPIIWKSAHGSIDATKLSPTLVYVRAVGVLNGEANQAVCAWMDGVLAAAPGPVTNFTDTFDQEGHDAAFRRGQSEWLEKNRPRLAQYHVLMRSKLVAMAVGIVSSVTGGGLFKTYSRLEDFEAALHALGGKRPKFN